MSQALVALSHCYSVCSFKRTDLLLYDHVVLCINDLHGSFVSSFALLNFVLDVHEITDCVSPVLFFQVVVQRVHIDGLGRTKDDFLSYEIAEVFRAKNLIDVRPPHPTALFVACSVPMCSEQSLASTRLNL